MEKCESVKVEKCLAEKIYELRFGNLRFKKGSSIETAVASLNLKNVQLPNWIIAKLESAESTLNLLSIACGLV